LFIIVKGLKPHHGHRLNYVREVTDGILRLCAKKSNQHVEKKSWEGEITLKKSLLNQHDSQFLSSLRGADFCPCCFNII